MNTNDLPKKKRGNAVLPEAQRYTHIQESSIRSVCYGKYKHAGGYLWEYD